MLRDALLAADRSGAVTVVGKNRRALKLSVSSTSTTIIPKSHHRRRHNPPIPSTLIPTHPNPTQPISTLINTQGTSPAERLPPPPLLTSFSPTPPFPLSLKECGGPLDDDLEGYLQITDNVLDMVSDVARRVEGNRDLEQAEALLNRLKRRSLYQFVGPYLL